MGRKLTYNEEEGGMAKAQLQKIEMYAAKLNEMIHPEDELEGWVQNKLSVVAAYMGDVKHYLDYALQNEPEYKEFANGGMMDKPRYWEVEFTWDAADDESRKVNVMAESVSDAEEQVKKKFSPYYEGLKVVEVEEDKEMSWEEYAKRPKKYEIESTTDYETIEADDEDDAKERWMKRRSADTIKSDIVSVKRRFREGGAISKNIEIFGKYKNNNTDDPYFYSSSNKGLDFLTNHKNIEVISIDNGRYDLFYGWDDNKQKDGVLYFGKWNNGKFGFNYYGNLSMAEGGKMASGGVMKYEGSTEEEDFKEAEEYIGKDVWETLSEEDKMNATQYLKAKGVIGYAGQEEELADFMASQYSKGGSLYRGMRPSPSISATAYPRGFKMIGNDGNMWEIALDSRGVHRWTKSSSASRNDRMEQKAKIREAIELLESMRDDIDVDDEIATLKKLQ
jgi:hypothetical protein